VRNGAGKENNSLERVLCITHHRVKPENCPAEAKRLHPDALLLLHPECKPEVAAHADYIGSTKQIIDYVKTSPSDKFIIGTEMGVLYKLKKDNPEKKFYMMSQGLLCPNMKKTSLKSVYEALRDMKYDIHLDEEIRRKAQSSLDRMLEIE
jgi:quinolinate synthase